MTEPMHAKYPTVPCQGLSISFCFRDMAQGHVNPDLVISIIAGTRITTDANLDSVIADYRQMYWRDCADTAEALCRAFFAAGKIHQPRVHNQPAPNISRGHWMIDGQIDN